MKLHEQYVENMKALLGDEFEAFMASYEDDRICGIRVNTLKISVEDFIKITPFELQPIPWTTDGFYIDAKERPGKHPYWHAGLYYIQEPSAMLPGSILDVQANQCVLDLCASPGGKTLQMAAKLGHTGVLVTNDISTGRIKPLVRNIEQFGVANAIVVNDSHDKLSKAMEETFDRILVDAPCSGEGMFRKDEGLIRDWTPESNTRFNIVQEDILAHAGKMLKRGGRLLYSTCTFSKTENEQVVETLIGESEEGEDLSSKYHFVHLWQLPGGIAVSGGTARIWPHKSRGEGHFAALMQKGAAASGGEHHLKTIAAYHEDRMAMRVKSDQTVAPIRNKGKQKERGNEGRKEKGTTESLFYQGMDNLPDVVQTFVTENLNIAGPVMARFRTGTFEWTMDRLNLLPDLPVNLKNIRVVRQGLQIGELSQGRFKPSQAWVMAMTTSDFKRCIHFKSGDDQLLKYLKGDTLMLDGELEEGLYLVAVDGYPLGLGKWDGKSFKNMYPPAWRMM